MHKKLRFIFYFIYDIYWPIFDSRNKKWPLVKTEKKASYWSDLLARVSQIVDDGCYLSLRQIERLVSRPQDLKFLSSEIK